MLAIIGASGKLGFATLSALLSNSLLPASSIVTTSSSQPDSENYKSLVSKGVQVRSANFDDAASLEKALHGCDALFLISSARINLDFHDAPDGQGREKDHKTAIDAARKAGVKHIYYTSLAFANPSKSNVMTAHERTEAYLKTLEDVDYTILREGLYNESWPLYLGHYDVKNDDRSVVPVAGDGKISWTAISDLGLASALILAAPREEWRGKTVYLSNTKDPRTLEEVASMVSKAKGRDIELKIVDRTQHEDYYIGERKMDEGLIRWWAKTYDALKDGECDIKDTTLEKLLGSKGVTPKRIEETIPEMVNAV